MPVNPIVFTWDLSLGNVATIVTILGSVWKLSGRMKRLEMRVAMMWGTFVTEKGLTEAHDEGN